MTEVVEAIRALGDEAWLVGGAIRDRLLGRATLDYDVALRRDAEPAARQLARAARGHAFPLSDAFGAWRVVSRDSSSLWQVDLTPLNGRTIEEDLGKRDFTINALAEPVAGGACIDPFGGRDDLHAQRLVMVSPEAFAADPLRTLRVARLAAELALSVDSRTSMVARAHARDLARVAVERVFAELKRIVVADRALAGLDLMDSLDITAVVLPELAALRGVTQSRYHHLDVYEHTRAVLAATIELERDPERVFGADAAAIADVLSEPLANELSRSQALRLGALLHDVAKPATRQVTEEGRVTFLGHDAMGAETAAATLARLRASERLQTHVAALVRHHLRLGFLVHQMPLSRRTTYSYLDTCGPVGVDVTVLSVADRLATRGRGSGEAIAKHLELARELATEALAWRRQPPQPPIRGDELAREVGLEPGPRLGEILAELEQATFAGEISGREEAIARARQLLNQ